MSVHLVFCLFVTRRERESLTAYRFVQVSPYESICSSFKDNIPCFSFQDNIPKYMLITNISLLTVVEQNNSQMFAPTLHVYLCSRLCISPLAHACECSLWQDSNSCKPLRLSPWWTVTWYLNGKPFTFIPSDSHSLDFNCQCSWE